MYAANAYFYVQIAVWASFMLANTAYENKLRYYKVYSLDFLNKLLPASLLVISILLFRIKFNSAKTKKLFASEKIILVHVAIFLSFIVVYAAERTLVNNSSSQP